MVEVTTRMDPTDGGGGGRGALQVTLKLTTEVAPSMTVTFLDAASGVQLAARPASATV